MEDELNYIAMKYQNFINNIMKAHEKEKVNEIIKNMDNLEILQENVFSLFNQII